MGADPVLAATVASAAPIGPDQSFAGDVVVTGLTRRRIASRNASSSPKNSVKARINPVVAANSRNKDAGNPIHRCHLRQNARFTRSPLFHALQSDVCPECHAKADSNGERAPKNLHSPSAGASLARRILL